MEMVLDWMDQAKLRVQPYSNLELLIDKINSIEAEVAIIGLGYVGLPLSVCVSKIGFPVTGLDINEEKIFQLNQGESYIADVSSEELRSLVEAGHLKASSDFDLLTKADIIIICVPTPLTKNHEPDISNIKKATIEITQRLRPGQFVTLESTTFPGTTEEVMLPILESSGLKVGEDFFLAHSPERVDPGNARYTTHNTNKVVGGYTEACQKVAAAFYQKSILNIIPVSSPGCAEMVKVFENTFRAVNIALVNELALLCDKMGLNIWEVVEAAATKPFGMLSFQPGPGVGGHCIPIDPYYLTWKAREYNFHTRFIELAGEINSHMPHFVREKIIRALGKQGKPLFKAKILIIGMAYKKDLGDWRHSPGLNLLNILQGDEANVSYSDPHVPEVQAQSGKNPYGKTYISIPLSEETLSAMDCVVIVTDHSVYDWNWIVLHSSVVVDTRNACIDVLHQRDKIVLL